MTRIELKNCYGTFVVEVPADDMTLPEIVESLLKPVLLAAGFHPDTVDEAFAE